MNNKPQINVNALRANSDDFEAFYNDHYDPISLYVARRLPPASHDEVVVSTFVVAWRKFAETREPSLSWLYRIASFEVAHERRRLRREPRLAELNDLELIDTLPKNEVIDISGALSQLTFRDAEILRMIYWENLSRDEVSKVLGISVNSVNVRHHRALDRLSGAVSRLSNINETTTPSPLENQ